MTRHEFAYQFVSLLENTNCNAVIDVSVNVEMEELLKRTQIIKKYGNDIKQIADGRYHIRYNGRQIFKKSYDSVIDEILKREKQSGIKTLDSIAEDFFEYRYTNSAGGTYGKDKYNYETFIKGTAIAQKDITKITLNDGVKWTTHCLEVKHNMKEKYFKNVRCTLNQMFQFAISNNWISKNPIEKVSIHKDHLVTATNHNDDDLIFSDSERLEVCKLAREDASFSKSAIPLAIPFLFATGLRDGELCALKWRDITQEELHIQAEMVEQRDKENKFLGYKYVGHTKTPAGNRIIAISSEVRALLTSIKQMNINNGFPQGKDDFVFLRTYKDTICECTTRCFETRIKKYCRQAHMSVLKSQHDARRTFATNLYYAGMSPKNIQLLLGHESLEQTMAYIKRKGAKQETLSYLEAISSQELPSVV